MNLFVFQRTAVTEQGNVIPNAEITVYAAGTTTEVDLFDDAAGTPKSNPFGAGPTDGEDPGFLQFYVTFGQYDIAVNGTVLWENQAIGRPELDGITSLSSLNTAALTDKQQFSVKDGDKIRLFAWNETADDFDELPVVTDTDNVTGAGTAITRDTGTAMDQVPLNTNIVYPLSDITALASLNAAALVALQQFNVGSYLPDTSTGSALLRWRPDLPKSRHDGVLFFSLTVPMFTGTATTDYRNGEGETDPTGNGVMELVRGEIIYGTTVLVPSYYSTLQESFDDLGSRITPGDGVVLTLNIETGHALTAGFRIDNKDLSWITITSTDATVAVSPTMTPVSTSDLDPGIPRTDRNAFVAVGSKMPRWEIVVDLTGPDIAKGYCLYTDSHGYVRPLCGVINTFDSISSSGANLQIASSCVISGYNSLWSPGVVGCAITQSSMANLAYADVRNCTDTGIDVSRGSVAYTLEADATGCVTGLYVRRSWASAQNMNFTNCSERAIWADQGSWIGANGSIMDGAAFYVLHAAGAHVDVTGSTDTGAAITADLISSGQFNFVTGRGVVTNQDYRESDTRLTAESAISVVAGDQITVAGTTFYTAYESATPEDIVGGTIFGENVGLRITIDGVVVLNDNVIGTGNDAGLEAISCVMIPPCVSSQSIKIEALNRATGTRNIGFKVYVK